MSELWGKTPVEIESLPIKWLIRLRMLSEARNKASKSGGKRS